MRLDDDLAADAEALARAEGKSLIETVKLALSEAGRASRQGPGLPQTWLQIIEQDGEPLERLAK